MNNNLKIDKIYNLSPMQEGMLFHYLMNRDSSAYFQQRVFTIKGIIDTGIFETGLNMIIGRHESLRTNFVYENLKRPQQVVLKERKLKICYHDISHMDMEEKETFIREFREKDRNNGFDLLKDLLIRAAVIRTAESENVVIFSYHHIIMDGWCMDIIANELFQAYFLLKKKLPAEFPKTYPYIKYIEWIDKRDKEEVCSFWKEYLAGYNQPAVFPGIKDSIEGTDYVPENYYYHMDAGLSKSLSELAKKNQVTLSMVFQAIWGTLLMHYNSSRDVVFGAVVSGRPAEIEGIEKMVGLFINTVPVRVKSSNQDTFRQLVKDIHQNSVLSESYSYGSLAEILSFSSLKNDLINNILVFENYPVKAGTGSPAGVDEELRLESSEMFEQTNYDMNVVIIPGDIITVKFAFNGLRYRKCTIEGMAGHMGMIASAVAENPDIPVAHINILTGEEIKQQIYDYNATDAEYPKDKTVLALFEEQAERTPNNIALECSDVKITYKELSESMGKLAGLLRQKGVESGSIVGIMADRSPHMVTAILAVMKAGAAYLPIDPDYPESRINYVLEDSGVKLVLTQDKYAGRLGQGCTALNLEDEGIYQGAVPVTDKSGSKKDLAYVIYTSGSTGTPKGTMICHGGLTNYIWWANRMYVRGEKISFPLYSSLSFDLTVTSIFTPLISGNSIIIYSGENKELLIKNILEENRVGIVKLTPTHLRIIKETGLESSSIRRLIVGGEDLKTGLARDISDMFRGNIEIYNEYGPTEATVGCMIHLYDRERDTRGSVPIGKPAANMRIYILDRELKPVAAGVTGEMYISGDGLAKGYLNRRELTEERFVANPFIAGERMYKTGDLARMLPEGIMEYIGRADQQVKIRGYRIEPGEIEAAILKSRLATEAAVVDMADGSGDKYLCAYVVPEEGHKVQDIRKYLEGELPGYMVPSRFVQLEKMPVSPNGKLDRKLLPAPDAWSGENAEYTAPGNETEEKLAAIWQELLGIEKIGIHDSFFEKGGHSIKLIMMCSRIHKEFKIDISISELFPRPTIAELAEYIRKKEQSIYKSVEPAGQREFYPVTPAQKRMFVLDRMEEAREAYNVMGIFKVTGVLEKDRLESALKALISRHDALRTCFEMFEKQPVQRISEEVDFNLEYREYEIEADSYTGNLNALIENELRAVSRPFNLGKAPLFRARLLKVSKTEYIFIYSVHHIIMDATSMEILKRDLVGLYNGEKLSQLKIQFKDYAVWHQNILSSHAKDKQEKYWMDLFKDNIPVMNLPTDYPRQSVQSFEGAAVKFRVTGEVAKGLKELAAKTGVTSYMLLLAAYNVLLSKYSGQEDIVVGSPVTVRPHIDLENVLGLFMNTLVMRNYPGDQKRFIDFLREVKENSLKAYENQDYQFEELVDKLKVPRDLSRNPLFDTMLELQFVEYQSFKDSQLALLPYEMETGISKLDITLHAIESAQGLSLVFQYCTALYRRETIERMGIHFQNILSQIIRKPDIVLSDINMMSDDEKTQIIRDFNNTAAWYPRDMLVHEMFEKQAERTPHNTAVIFGGKSLTYGQLDKKTNQLARALREKGVKRDSIVAIIAERSFEMIIGIMSVLKAGGAYLPIDPGYPGERIKYMLMDSEAHILLYENNISENYSFIKHAIDLTDQKLYTGEDSALEKANTSRDLAYVIYTSGSTGRPKGTMIEHYSVINRLLWMQKKYPIGEGDVILQKTPYTFDVSVWELFWWAFAGAGVCFLEPGEEKNPEAIVEAVNKNSITTMHFVPSMLNVFLDYVREQNCFEPLSTLKQVFSSGEALRPQEVSAFNALLYKNNGTRLHNLYGPTEATVDVTYYDCPVNESPQIIPIGKPIDNIRLYILSKAGGLQPIGIPGELCIAGDGVGRGYLKQPELQLQKFVTDPFKDGERMYRTGDLARWMADGNIEYLGRIDEQVKIRGFRIEKGEIEARLLSHRDIKQAVVLDREDKQGNKYLCAYIVFDNDISVTGIREYLLKELPDYMVPAYFVKLQNLPVTSNGKIDKKKLSRIEPDRDKAAVNKMPRNETEKLLANVWQEVLVTENIGINDNYFELGGDSIKAIQILMRLKKYGIKLEMKHIFKHPIIKELALYAKAEKANMNQETIEDTVRLTPIQSWLFERNNKGVHHFNQSVMLYSDTGFGEQAVRKVFNKLLKHHDALRMIYKCDEHGILQYNRGILGELYKLRVFDLVGRKDYKEAITDEADRLQSSIELENGPLVQLGLFKTAHGDHLLIIIHHLVVDGVSWRILLEDIALGFEQIEKDEEVSFQDKTDSFKKWSDKIYQYANSDVLYHEIDYWKQLKHSSTGSLLKKGIENKTSFYSVKTEKIIFSKEQTDMLLKKANSAYNTETKDILLTALGLAIKECTGEDKVLIDVEGHGREEIFEDIDITRTVGWFTSLFPVVLEINSKLSLSMQIREVKEQIRHIPNKGIGYGILRYISQKGSSAEICPAINPEICFNYLGQVGQYTEAGALKISHIPRGRSVSPDIGNMHPVEISSIISDGVLIVSFSYDENCIDQSKISVLIDRYENSLSGIIEHCVNRKSTQLTPSDYGDSELAIEELGQINKEFEGIGEIQYIYTLSAMQEGMLFHNLLNNTSSQYFEQMSYSIKGSIDMNLFEKSFNRLLQRYDVFRTNFIYEGMKNPRQVVLKSRKQKMHYEDISHLQPGDQELFIDEFKRKDRTLGFDLSKDALLRAAVFRKGEKLYHIIWSFHHIIMDGWCISIVSGDFFRIYMSMLNNTGLDLKEAYPYREYISWLKKQNRKETQVFWENYLNGYEYRELLPKSNEQEKVKVLQSEIEFSIDEETGRRISDFSRENHCTMSTVMQTIWGILLQKYSNSKDIVFGVVVSGRPSEIAEIEDAVGLFINTVPLRIQCNEDSTFASVVKEVQETALSTQKHLYHSLAEIQTKAGFKKGLLDNIMVFENYPVEKRLWGINENPDMGFEIDNISSFEQTNYDLNVIVTSGKNLNVRLRYNGSVYPEELMDGIANHIAVIALAVAENPDIPVAHINILTGEEIKQQIYDYNATDAEYPKDKTVLALFEEQAERTPNNIALECSDVKITYKELSESMGKLAGLLRQKGVESGSIVGIMADRSPHMVTAILAVMKAGAAYLPIDPDYPESRINYVLEDSGVKLVLTQDKYAGRLGQGCTALNLEDEGIYQGAVPVTDKSGSKKDLAYVIYTSGSTGTPKGTMICHGGLTNYIWWANRMYVRGEKISFPLYSSLSFDLTVTSIFTPLISGNSIIIYSGENKELLIKNILEENRVGIVKLTPTHLRIIKETGLESSSIRRLIVGGEDLKTGLARDISDMFRGNIEIYNEYGPTEATVGCMIHLYDRERDTRGSVPIGKPAANMRIYILDRELKPVAAGVTGEMYISGDGLAKGYLNRRELTEERFVANPFIAGERMYKTGDLARMLPEGIMEYIGRADQQVKIRGYRIEPGEIEAAILKSRLATEAAVVDMADGSGDKYLCAYVVPEEGHKVQDIRKYLEGELPGYMVPSRFVQLEKMPVSPNGKLDRKLLPAPDAWSGENAEYTAPGNETEEKLAAIWQELLGIKRIGIHDSFFEKGGHSLTVIRLHSRLQKEFGVDISFNDLFEMNTIAMQAEMILNSEVCDLGEIYPEITPDTENLHKPFPLTEVQTAYLIGRDESFEMGGTSTHAYMEYETNLDIERLNKSLQRVIDRHGMLRTIIHEDGTQQILQGKLEYRIEVLDLTGCDTDTRQQYIKNERSRMSHFIFKTDQWPLFEIKAFKLDNNTNYLFISMDVLIADGFSMKIIARELGEFYMNPDNEPDELSINFRDYMIAYQQMKNSSIYQIDRQYWMKKLDDFPSSPEILLKQKPSNIRKPHFRSFSKTIDKERWSQLKSIALKKNITPSALLLTAYSYVLEHWSNQKEMTINLTVFNRYPFHREVDKIVGDFTSLILVDIYLDNKDAFWENAGRLQKNLMDNLNHRHYDGVEFIREIAKNKNMESKVIMPVVFTSVLHEGDSEAAAEVLTDAHNGQWKSQVKMSITQSSQVYIDNKAVERNGQLIATWDYVEELFDEEVISAMYNQYMGILDMLVSGEEQIRLELAGKDSESWREYNSTVEDIQLLTLHGLVTRQAALTPDNTAVIFENESMTYRELEEKSNRVARYLEDQNMEHGSLVGVMGHRNIDSIVSILGILKAGAAYVPIDPSYPEERKAYICQNSSCRLILDHDIYRKDFLNAYSGEAFEGCGCLDDMAYIIYTSGSTGKPKGVMITHRAAANTIIDMNRKFNISEKDKFLGISSLCFDLSVYDVFGALSTGAALVLVRDQRDVAQLVDTVRKQKITIWNSVPVIMDMAVQNLESKSRQFIQDKETGRNSGDEIYYWSPVIHWRKDGGKIYIEERQCPEIAARIFPELYFMTQKGVSINELTGRFGNEDYNQLITFINGLIASRVFVKSILNIQEVFSSQKRLFKNNYSENIVYMEEESDKFKKKQLSRSYKFQADTKIRLHSNFEYPKHIENRRTYRSFDKSRQIPFSKFSYVMSILKQKVFNGETRYYYAAAGGLYPVDVYIYVKEDRVENLSKGLYYYDPKENSLEVVDSGIEVTGKVYNFTNKEIFNSSAFSMYLIYNAEANMPKYSSMGYFFACIDTGVMVGTLTQAAELSGIGLCSIGSINFDIISSHFKLNENQVLLHTIEFGLKADGAEENGESEFDNSYGKGPYDAALAVNSPEKVSEQDLALDNGTGIFESLRVVMLSGDWIPLNLPGRLRGFCPGAEIISLGGATEGSIWSIFHPIKDIEDNWISIPYGKPLANQKVFVLDNYMELCPVGVKGELYIGGAGVAAGYHNDEERTGSSFIHHDRLGYIYRTGDYGVLHKEGYVEFLGRKDQQIKIRGYRIELGEIESQLLKHEDIKEAVAAVVADSGGRKCICAYIVSGKKLSNKVVREFLKNTLPEYMLPSYVVLLDEMPLSPNGKIDRKRLPVPEAERENSSVYEAPVNEIEEKIIEIWKKLLNVGTVSRNDSIFELGGDSVKAISLVSEFYETFRVRVSLREIFSKSTVAEMADIIQEKLLELNDIESILDDIENI